MHDLWHMRQREFFTPEMEKFKSVFLAHSVYRSYARNETVFNEGDPGNFCYYIRSGVIRIFSTRGAGKETAFFLRREGELFGLSEIFNEGTRRASAGTVTAVELYCMDSRTFSKLVDEEPVLAKRCVTVLGSRVRILTDCISGLVATSVKTRLVYQLISFVSENLNSEADWHSPVTLPIRLTQEHFASLVGSTQPTISDLFQSLQKQGVLLVERRKITIMDPMALLSCADNERNDFE